MKTATTARAPQAEVDLDQAKSFLNTLDPGGLFTFQTFDERKGKLKDSSLVRVLHGTFDENAERLRDLNKRGAGVYVMVNEGDGITHEGENSCRTTVSVTRVRAVFVDLDGTPLQPVVDSNAPPSIIVNSSPGKWHAYWKLTDCPLPAFTGLQEALAEKFDSDPVVTDLPRVLRVSGFFHQKDEPHLVQLLEPLDSNAALHAPYSVADLSRLLGLPARSQKKGEHGRANED